MSDRAMFSRMIQVECVAGDGSVRACPLKGLDSFAMRNFTNDAIFDDTLPVADGLLEAGNRVPLDRLQAALEDWLRRKSVLSADESLHLTELTGAAARR